MSTNFFIQVPSDCNNPAHGERLHIGQNAGGWQFLFQAYRDKPLKTWHQWIVFLAQNATSFNLIIDEYGRGYTLDEFIRYVEASRDKRERTKSIGDFDYTDDAGYSFSYSDFF